MHALLSPALLRERTSHSAYGPGALPTLRAPRVSSTVSTSTRLSKTTPATTFLAAPPLPLTCGFRQTHHYHVVPGVRGIVPEEATFSNDQTAITRYLGALSLQFDHLARVVGIVPAHAFLGAAVGFVFFFGARQGLHALLLDYRAIRQMHLQRNRYRQEIAAEGAISTHLAALLRQNSSDQWQMLYYTGLDASATMGSLGVGVGELFRHPLLGYIAPTLVHAALPTLSIAFGPLVAPSVIGSAEKLFRTARTYYKNRNMQTYLAASRLPDAARLGGLFAQRQRELRNYYFGDCLARAGLAAGASISVFVGPGGLLLLVPSIVAVVASECYARRITRLGDALPTEERLLLRDAEEFREEICATDDRFQCLRHLRTLRSDAYPRGWGTPLRRLIRLQRWLGRSIHDDPVGAKYTVLATAARQLGQQEVCRNDVLPFQLLQLMALQRVWKQFAQAIVSDDVLRQGLQGRGIQRERKPWLGVFKKDHWQVKPPDLARFMSRERWGSQTDRQLIDAVYLRAEETLLTSGKTEAHRRLRALLDAFYRFIRTPTIPAAAAPSTVVIHSAA